MQGVRSQRAILGHLVWGSHKMLDPRGQSQTAYSEVIWDTLELNYGEIMPNNQKVSFMAAII